MDFSTLDDFQQWLNTTELATQKRREYLFWDYVHPPDGGVIRLNF